MPPLKICMLSPTGPSLASARHLLSAGRALAARGIEVAAVVPHHYYLPFEEAGGADEENLGGVAVRHVRLPSRWRGSVRTHFFPAGYWSWGMVRRAMETPFDIVHAMKPYYTSGPAGLLLSILTGKPLVLECDDLEGRDGWARSLVEEPLFGFKRRLIETFERRLPALADAVIASSRALEEILLARGVARERLFYIPYCVEEYMTRRGDGAAARSAFGLGEDPTAIYCGALHPHNYDVDMLIPAMEHVRAAIPRARMLVVGDGGARPGLERAARERGLLGGAISFAGWVAVERIPDHIAAADVAVVPLRDTPASRCRGLSKVLEYLCQGVPVVMPRVGQAEELTDGGAAGLLVRPGDARALADGIIELLRDPERAKEMGARGRRHATTRFSADGAASARIEVYRFAAGQPCVK